MLREILDVLQDDPRSQRRWFHDDYFDLFLRQTGGELVEFELCYGIHSSERALAWSRDRGYFHDGGKPGSSDVIGARIAADRLDSDPIIARFEGAAHGMPEELRAALRARLLEYVRQKAAVTARRTRFRRADWQQSGAKHDPKADRSRNS